MGWVLSSVVILALAAGAAHFLSYTDPSFVPVATPFAPLSPHPASQPLRCQVLSTDFNGPEDFAFQGKFGYSGLHNGSLIRFSTEGDFRASIVGHTGGRPLGLRFAPDGKLWIADAIKGVLTWTEKEGFQTIFSEVDGKKCLFIDHLVISKDGKDIYISDASGKRSYGQHLDDLWEGIGTGRILHYNVDSKKVRVLASGLFFSNGVALTPEEDAVVYSETYVARVSKVYVRGPKSGKIELLKGTHFVDNITPDTKPERVWLAYVAKHEAQLDFIVNSAFLRRVIRNLPVPKKQYCSTALLNTVTNEFVAQYEVDNLDMCTVFAPHGDSIWVGSFSQSYIARCQKPVV